MFQDTKDPLKPGVNVSFDSDKIQNWELCQFLSCQNFARARFLFFSPPIFLYFADSIFPNNWISCHETGEVGRVDFEKFSKVANGHSGFSVC